MKCIWYILEHLLGDDLMGLLFHFLDELLFLMCDDPYFIVKVSNCMLFRKYESSITRICVTCQPQILYKLCPNLTLK